MTIPRCVTFKTPQEFSDYCLHLYCYFYNVSAEMSSGLLRVFFELGNLNGTSNYVLYWIHGVSCSDSVSHTINNNKEEDNCPKTLNDKNHQASFQKFRQLTSRLHQELLLLSRGTQPKRSLWLKLARTQTPLTPIDKQASAYIIS